MYFARGSQARPASDHKRKHINITRPLNDFALRLIGIVFEAGPRSNRKERKMISSALSNVAASLSQVQGQIPASDPVSVQALQQAYQLIAQVQSTYQGQ
jgi:hypothetical protein